MPDFPPTLPSREPDWPIPFRRYLTHRLLQQHLALNGGWRGLLVEVYRGEQRTEGRVSWTPSADDCYLMAVRDATDWLAAKALHTLPPSETPHA